MAKARNWSGALPLSKPHPARVPGTLDRRELVSSGQSALRAWRQEATPGNGPSAWLVAIDDLPRPTPCIGVQRPLGLWWGEPEGGKAPLGPA